MTRSFRPGARSRSALAAVAVGALFGCSTTPGGPEYTEFAIDTLDAAGQQIGGDCTPLPVLPGGTLERDVALAPGLSAHVLAVRDGIELTLHGTSDSVHLSVPQTTLLAGYSKRISVTTTAGETYTLVLASTCGGVDGGLQGG